jgi:hypothetical protein
LLLPLGATSLICCLADNKQQALYARYAQEQSKRKIERTNAACKKKLQVSTSLPIR